MKEPYATIILILFVITGTISTMKFAEEYTQANSKAYSAFHETTNHSITGIYFPQESLCIHLSGRNEEAIKNTLDHEYLHHLIEEEQMCGNETCREHFCGCQKIGLS